MENLVVTHYGYYVLNVPWNIKKNDLGNLSRCGFYRASWKLYWNMLGKRVWNKLNIGLWYFWNNANISLNDFPIIKQRIRDIYIQQWRTRLPESLKLDCYSKFKLNFEFESYLVNVKNDAHRNKLTHFRVSSHSLTVETGRYIGIERKNRLCIVCSPKQPETEYHFLLTWIITMNGERYRWFFLQVLTFQ